nr:DNA-directed DNA polymerase [Tanacetum cinerariifolium]
MDLKLAEESKEKSSIEEPSELELKDLPSHLEYAFLEDSNKLPVIIAKNLKVDEREALLNILKSHKWAIAWKISDIKGIDPRFCTHKILIEDDYKPAVQSQRRVNPEIHDVIKKEVIKLLDGGMIYPISDSPGVCIDYRKLNDATRKDHFPLPFMDQMLERLAGNEFYCFLDGFSRYFQIPIDPQDQEKTTFTCPYGTFTYRRMPFGLCNAPGTFKSCMMSIFHDMIKKTMEVFMDDFSVFGDTFSSCLTNLDKILKRCKETNLVLNWEKCHFMCREGIVLGHKISKSGIEVDREKVDVIAKLPHPTTVKGVRRVLGHAGFYRRFIQDFLKIARPMTHLLKKETPFIFSTECIDAFNTLKKKVTEAPILVVPDWNLPFELMCDASDYAIGENRMSLSDKLDDDLWAFCTAYKTSIGCTPYKLTAGDYRKIQINELNELRDQAYENSLIYKEKTKRIHDSKIKNRVFNIGDRALLFNSCLKIFSGKLKSHWSGPFTVSQVFPYGTVELSQPDGPNFKVNGHRIKHYFGEDIPQSVVPDFQTLAKDH